MDEDNDNMFTYEQIKSLNHTETVVFNYVLDHLEDVLDMSVRDLAAATFVSTATVTRFVRAVGCDGFNDFKVKLKEMYEEGLVPTRQEAGQNLTNFFQYAETEAFNARIQEMLGYMVDKKFICFFGMGNTAATAQYAARYFSNTGFFAYAITDPFYPPLLTNNDEIVMIFISRSGETQELLNQVVLYRDNNTRILSITNHKDCTLARMSDCNMDVNVNDAMLPLTYDLTTQVPFVYIVERMALELQRRYSRIMPAWKKLKSEAAMEELLGTRND